MLDLPSSANKLLILLPVPPNAMLSLLSESTDEMLTLLTKLLSKFRTVPIEMVVPIGLLLVVPVANAFFV